jgi:SP family facilitated glucose transporter-like MFS transporter 3
MASSSLLAEPLLPDPNDDTNESDNRNESLRSNPLAEGDESGQDQPSEQRFQMSVYFYFTVSVVCIPMFLFGYNTGVLNAPESVIFPSHSVSEWSITVSAFCAGGFFGAYGSGSFSDRFGRRPALILVLIANFSFGVLHYIAPTMKVLILARFGVGLAGGASTVLTPMMLSEISSKDIRGSIGTLTQLSCVLGILASILYALPFCTIDKWRYIFVPLPVISLCGLLATPWCLPESPQWLLMNHYVSRGQEAKNTMRLFRKFKEPSDAEELIEMEVLQLLGGETPSTALRNYEDTDTSSELPMFSNMATSSLPGGEIQESEVEETESTFRDYVSDPRNRIALASSLLFPVAQQLSGINAVFYYSTSFLEGAISNPQTGTIIAFSVNVLSTLVALLLMDRCGRRTLLSWSAGGMFVCCILLTCALKGILPGYITVVAVMLYISFFEIGLGCIPFFLASEMIEPQFLGTVQSITMASNWFSNFCVGMFFPVIDKSLGAYSFIPFATILFLTALFSTFVLPETRGKTVQEVIHELDDRRQQSLDVSPSLLPQGPVAQSRQSSSEPDTMLV